MRIVDQKIEQSVQVGVEAAWFLSRIATDSCFAMSVGQTPSFPTRKVFRVMPAGATLVAPRHTVSNNVERSGHAMSDTGASRGDSATLFSIGVVRSSRMSSKLDGSPPPAVTMGLMTAQVRANKPVVWRQTG